MAHETQADQGELEIRLEYIRSCIAGGMNQAAIVNHIREEKKDWNITDRQVRNYYATVWKEYGNDATGVDRAAYFVRTLDRLDHIYGVAMEAKDFKSALQATGELIRLLRLDIPSADFDWKKAAKEAGLSPSDVFEQVVQAVQASKELTHAETTDD